MNHDSHCQKETKWNVKKKEEIKPNWHWWNQSNAMFHELIFILLQYCHSEVSNEYEYMI